MSKNKIIGIAGLLISAFYGYGIIKLPQAGATFLSGTKIFLILIVFMTVVFSIIIFLQDFKKGAVVDKLVLDKKVLKTIGIYVVIFVIYTLIFETVGFIISTIFLLTALLSILNKGKIKANLLIGIIFPITIYLIFAKLFSISLPRGLIRF